MSIQKIKDPQITQNLSRRRLCEGGLRRFLVETEITPSEAKCMGGSRHPAFRCQSVTRSPDRNLRNRVICGSYLCSRVDHRDFRTVKLKFPTVICVSTDITFQVTF